MNKVAVLLTAALIAGFVIMKYSLVDRNEAFEEQNVDEKMANYRCFKQTLEDSLHGLADGTIGLKDAQVRVQEAARRFFPPYLQGVMHSGDGTTIDECIAQNLIAHLHNYESPIEDARLRELENELADMAGEKNP